MMSIGEESSGQQDFHVQNLEKMPDIMHTAHMLGDVKYDTLIVWSAYHTIDHSAIINQIQSWLNDVEAQLVKDRIECTVILWHR